MFYCDKCRNEYGWPFSLYRSFGRCEMCGNTTRCNDVPSSQLPQESVSNDGTSTSDTDD